MASKNVTQVLIAGKIVTISGYESEEYLQKVAAYLNNKLTELSELPGYVRQPMDTKQTLLALNIADDYYKAKKQAEIFEEDLQLKDREMYDLKHELISLQVQLENSKKELERLKSISRDIKEQVPAQMSHLDALNEKEYA